MQIASGIHRIGDRSIINAYLFKGEHIVVREGSRMFLASRATW